MLCGISLEELQEVRRSVPEDTYRTHRAPQECVSKGAQLYKPPSGEQRPFWASLRTPAVRQQFISQLQQNLGGAYPTQEVLDNAIANAAKSTLPKFESRKPPGLPWERDVELQRLRTSLMAASKAKKWQQSSHRSTVGNSMSLSRGS